MSNVSNQINSLETSLNNGLPIGESNRKALVATLIAVVVLVAVIAIGFTVFQKRTEAAQTAFGNAMSIYQTPIAQPGQQVPPGVKTYSDQKARAAEASSAFQAVADQYGMTKPGKLARYFQGVSLIEQGQNASAETTLKQASGSWNGDVAALAKLALAQLDQQTGRDADAIALYNELSTSKAATVPGGLAQIQLAELYESQGKPAEAKKIYAQLKDSDKDAKGNPGPAGQVAASRLAQK
ncbi:tetratricopeptide repeat protein [Granulicella cerasi]|uniref:Tetratricopeptide repeat protein n=1 Tax=Granulicella cerasi TaxID=741063 RepID=A0ABW1ZBB6_9BACT|nr:tetratricopeptide repeat protein [Granulicella cerasi]